MEPPRGTTAASNAVLRSRSRLRQYELCVTLPLPLAMVRVIEWRGENMRNLRIGERPYIEHFDGEARLKMPPSQYHNLVQPRMWAVLERCAGDRGFAGTEPHMRLGAADGTDTVFVPDVAYTSKERYQRDYPGGDVVPDFAPDIAVEIRSPGVDLRELERKRKKYLACGTTLVLDIDPHARSITAYASSLAPRTFVAGEDFEHPAFPWLRFQVSEIFAGLDRFENVLKERR
jgi:Uma2 family endonuclease